MILSQHGVVSGWDKRLGQNFDEKSSQKPRFDCMIIYSVDAWFNRLCLLADNQPINGLKSVSVKESPVGGGS